MNLTGGRIATFAVSRIRNVIRTGRMFDPAPDFDVAAVIRDAFGIVRGDKVMRVRLLFSPRVAAYIRERVWHPSQHMVDKRNGAVELALETGGWNELVRWILSWQPDVVVKSPQAVERPDPGENTRRAYGGIAAWSFPPSQTYRARK